MNHSLKKLAKASSIVALSAVTLITASNLIQPNQVDAIHHNKMIKIKQKDIKSNHLSIKSKMSKKPTISTYGGAKVKFEKIPYKVVNGEKVGKETTGWPYHYYNDEDYRTNKQLHSSNVIGHLGTGKKGNEVYKVTMPAKASKNTKITINYNHAVKYNGKYYDVTLTIDDFRYYNQNYWNKRENGKKLTPDVYISSDFSRGIWYDGIVKANATYDFKGLKEFDKGTYVTFNSLNGVYTYKNPAYKRKTRWGINAYWTNEYFFKYSTSSATNWQRSWKAADDKKPFYPAGFKKPVFDQTGKFVTYNNDTKGYTYSYGSKYKSAIISYKSKISGLGVVNGGKADSYYHNSKLNAKDYATHSILYDVAKKGNKHSFTFGSGEGYGNFSISSKGYPKSPTPKKENPTNEKINKTVDKARIHKQNETFTYTIKGQYPEKHKTQERIAPFSHTESRTGYRTVGTGKNKHTESYTYYVSVPEYHYRETNTKDYWTFKDEVPKDVSIQSISTNNISLSRSGNTLTSKLDNEGLKNKSDQSYEIKIKVKADNLPKATSSGWSDSPQKYGMYFINNTANSDYMTYSNNHTQTSGKVRVGIERWEGTVHHYDFDNQDSGDFSYKDIAWGTDNWQDNTNYNDEDIKTEKIYGYENDEKKVNVLKDAKNSDGKTYQFIPGGSQVTVKFPTLDPDDTEKDDYPNDAQGGEDDEDMQIDYYLPYIVGKTNIDQNMVKIDTDKQKNGLPFKMYLRLESLLYLNKTNDYDGSSVRVTVNQKDKNGNELSKPVMDSGNHSLNSLTKDSDNGVQWWNLEDKLTNVKDPDNTSEDAKPGQKINFTVHVQLNSTDKVDMLHGDLDVDTYGFISSEDIVNDTNFKNNDSLTMNQPVRTIKYNGSDRPRVLYEALRADQKRIANAKTGYGMKNDFNIQYASWNFKGSDVKQIMDDATKMDYIFPKAFAKNGADHDSSSIKKDQESGFKDSDSAINYQTYSGNQLETNKDGSMDMLTDQLQRTNSYANSGQYNPKLTNSTRDALTDSFQYPNNTNKESMENARELAAGDGADVEATQFDESQASFKTEYNFYRRIASFGANLPTGTIGLANNDDQKASNKINFDAYTTDGGQRFYTPYWLNLNAKTTDTKYPTYWIRDNQSSRLGGNYYNILNRRPIKFYAHMYLANNSKTDQDDELSLQPLMTKSQIPNGFSDTESQWLKNNAFK